MKKFLFGAFATTALSVTLASCSSEEPMPVPSVPNNHTEVPSVSTNDELVTVSFNASIPKGIHSRSTSGAWPEWTPADGPLNLEVGVYSGGSLVLQHQYENVSMADTYPVELNLAKEGNYRVVFVATNALGAKQYEVDWENSTINNVGDAVRMQDDPFNSVNAGKSVLFVYDDDVTINPAEQTNYSITLRRPTAEVVFISNCMQNPSIASTYRYGIETAFGQYAGSEMCQGYAVYNFLTGKVGINKKAPFMRKGDYQTMNDGVLLTYPGYENYDVLWRGQLFVDKEGGSSAYSTPSLVARSLSGGGYVCNPMSSLRLERNKRYVLVDNSGSNNGDGEEPGGIFSSVTTFTTSVDASWGDSTTTTL